tara:strand:- start:5744 stop:5908 length:165 start_codon:yes stop_codon:yes gene_type:complete
MALTEVDLKHILKHLNDLDKYINREDAYNAKKRVSLIQKIIKLELKNRSYTNKK